MGPKILDNSGRRANCRLPNPKANFLTGQSPLQYVSSTCLSDSSRCGMTFVVMSFKHTPGLGKRNQNEYCAMTTAFVPGGLLVKTWTTSRPAVVVWTTSGHWSWHEILHRMWFLIFLSMTHQFPWECVVLIFSVSPQSGQFSLHLIQGHFGWIFLLLFFCFCVLQLRILCSWTQCWTRISGSLRLWRNFQRCFGAILSHWWIDCHLFKSFCCQLHGWCSLPVWWACRFILLLSHN